MDAATQKVLEDGLRALNDKDCVAKGVTAVSQALRHNKARIVFLAVDAHGQQEKELVTDLCKHKGVKLEIIPSTIFLGYAFSRSMRKKVPTPRTRNSWGCCAVIKYGSIVTPAINAFRAMFDPSTEDAPG